MNADDLLLISLGGAAAGIARRVAERSPAPMRALILDTDDAVLQTLTPTTGVSTTIFGTKRLAGRGTGGDHSLGAGALRDDAASLQAQIGSPRLAVVLTCCGGGTSGAAPLLLGMLREQGVATLTFATAPFAFEGDDRRRAAAVLLPTLESCSDALARIPLDTLLEGFPEGRPAAEAFAYAADRIGAGVALLWSLLTHPGFLPFDAERFHRLLTNTNATGLPFCFADATAEGPDRAATVLHELIASPRFRSDGIDRLANAAWLAVGVLAGPDLRLCELGTLMEGLRGHCQSLREAYLGTAHEERREGRLSVVALAFGLPAADVGRRDDDALRPLRGGKPKGKGQRSRLGSVKDRFADVEHTLFDGQDLDEPTYRRRGIRLTR